MLSVASQCRSTRLFSIMVLWLQSHIGPEPPFELPTPSGLLLYSIFQA
jgi:hypothetical protein